MPIYSTSITGFVVTQGKTLGLTREADQKCANGFVLESRLSFLSTDVAMEPTIITYQNIPDIQLLIQ